MYFFLNQVSNILKELSSRLGFASVVIITMSITLGALVCAITLNYLLLIKPLPYPNQENLYIVENQITDSKDNIWANNFHYPSIVHLYKNHNTFDRAAMITYASDIITSIPKQPKVQTAYATPSFFKMLSVPLAVGRYFDKSEELDKYNPSVVLSYYAWGEIFGYDKNILNKKVTLNGVSFKVIGVIDETFYEPQINKSGKNTDIWIPWDFNLLEESERESWVSVKGSNYFISEISQSKVAPSIDVHLTDLVNRRWQDEVSNSPFFSGWSTKSRLTPLKKFISGDSETVAIMLLLGGLGLVIIAFATTLNLFISRAAEQQRQLAIRAAVGAKKKHLVQHQLIESSILMTFTALVSLVIASIGFSIIKKYLNGVLPRVTELELGLVTISITVIISIAFAFLFAYMSSRLIDYRRLISLLQGGGKGTGVQVSARVRKVLVISQVAVSVFLIFVNLLLLQNSLDNLFKSKGFDTDNIESISLSLMNAGSFSEQELDSTISEVRRKLSLFPYVEYVSQSSSPVEFFSTITLTDIQQNSKFTVNFKNIDQDYFVLNKQSLMKGRDFNSVDVKDKNKVLVVNQMFATLLQEDGDVLGMQLETAGNDSYTIIGVVSGIYLPGEMKRSPRVYFVNRAGGLNFIVKSERSNRISRSELANLINDVDPRLKVFDLVSVNELYNRLMFTPMTIAISTFVLACLVITMAGVGLFGILKYSMLLRSFEFGIRMSIGAKPSMILQSVVREYMQMAITGVIISAILITFVLFTFDLKVILISNYFIGFSFILALLIVVSIIWCACYLPLRQILRRPVINILRTS